MATYVLVEAQTNALIEALGLMEECLEGPKAETGEEVVVQKALPRVAPGGAEFQPVVVTHPWVRVSTFSNPLEVHQAFLPSASAH